MITAAANDTAGKRPTILIVEDEWLIAIDLVESIEAAGCNVAGPAH